MAQLDLTRRVSKKLFFKKTWKERIRKKRKKKKERSFSLVLAHGNGEVMVLGGGR